MGNHRFTLRREWNRQHLGILNFIMLNPSTADDVFDDATIRRCIGFAKLWGFSGLVVTNLFAYRATDPKDLKRLIATDKALAIGEGNDEHIDREAQNSDATICAWGDNCDMLLHRDLDVVARLRWRDLLCIRKSAKGNPVHPVREPYRDAPEVLYSALQDA